MSKVVSNKALWTGRVLGGLPILFLAVDGIFKLIGPDAVVKGAGDLGYPVSTMFGIGLACLAGVVLYVIPKTSLIGAILLTGYLGGAVATHVRVDHPLFTHTLFPIYFAIALWASLVLRNARVRAALVEPE